MSIIFEEKKKIFTIHTKNTTYQFMADPYGFLLHLYYGRRSEGEMDYLLTFADRGFSGNPYDTGDDRTHSLDALPQEYPHLGVGDFRNMALIVKNPDGSYGCDLRYQGYRICDGKYGIPGLPAVYASEDEAQTLEVMLEDTLGSLQVTLLYGVLPELDIITRCVKITSTCEGTIYLDKVQSACLDFVAGDYDMISFYGRHMMERQMNRCPILHGTQRIGSRRGTSSHQYNPMMIIANKDTTEAVGSCWGLNFVYSGNFKGEAERDQYNQTRILMGLQDESFLYPLEKGEVFWAPEVIMTYSAQGFSGMSRNMHACIRKNLCRGKYRDAVRPVLLNSWEAFYFNFTGEDIYNLAKEAADLGMDMIVMDDGWFGKREDDNSGLGDWYVNEKKLGMPLGELVRKVNDLGIKFGIWFEPEAVNEDSDLYREHPDWAFVIPGRKPVLARNQLMLDFTRKDVVDYIYKQMCDVLDQGNIEYVKWDMNRSLTDCFSHEEFEQGKVQYDYVLGVYDLLERLNQRYPDLLLEGCSGGGGRFDAGMLYYTPQIWCSDNTDALDRVKIQYGTSFGYPVSTMGAHVSVSPNHQTGRITPMSTRGIVAMSGSLGYELDPSKCSEEEKAEIREQIRKYKEYAPLLYNGTYYRLNNPDHAKFAAWALISGDGSEVLLNVVRLEVHGNMLVNYIRLKGLKPGVLYRDTQTGQIYPSDALMQMGLPLPTELGDYRAYQMHLTEYKGD